MTRQNNPPRLATPERTMEEEDILFEINQIMHELRKVANNLTQIQDTLKNPPKCTPPLRRVPLDITLRPNPNIRRYKFAALVVMSCLAFSVYAVGFIAAGAWIPNGSYVLFKERDTGEL
jgi:hypothetical protein